jgi:hypothetical protein
MFSNSMMMNLGLSIPVPMLDLLTFAPAAAYGVRRLSTDYTGPLLRVRRSSDNAELDIGYTNKNKLDVDALMAFVGSDSAFVPRWYSQKSEVSDAVQTSAIAQPRIVNAGVMDTLSGRPTLIFDGVNSFMLIGNIVQGPNSSLSVSTMFEVIAHKAGTADSQIFTNSSFGAELSLRFRPGIGLRLTTGFGQSSTPVPIGVPYVLAYRGEGGAQSIRMNSQVAFSSTLAASAEQTAPYGIAGGASGADNRAGNFKMSELIVWRGILGATDLSTLENNQANFYGVTLP